jgi:16S rRNA (cytidine1402-2'-O)-methyltransferase
MPLVLVATPLGNLGDITLRSIDALKAADLIVAEDTRVARRLLNALDIGPKVLWSYREQNAEGATPEILKRAESELVVLVTDAGMPGVSDPGNELVAAARASGVAIDVLPGPSAALGVAVLSGFSLRRFSFEGFPPRASGARKAALHSALASGMTSVWYESPQRILDTLADLAAVAPDATVFVLREYTKKFEQQVLGTPSAVRSQLEEPVRGEVAFAIAPYEVTDSAPEQGASVDERMDALLDEGRSVAEVAKALAKSGGGDRSDLYARVSERKRRRASDEK